MSEHYFRLPRVRSGRFIDFYRGNGWFVSVRTKFGWWSLSVRRRWHMYAVRPPGKPCTWRIYIGPFELERATRRHEPPRSLEPTP